jgi:hypothetical protein
MIQPLLSYKFPLVYRQSPLTIAISTTRNSNKSSHTSFFIASLSVLTYNVQRMSTIQVPKSTLSRYGGWIPSSRHVHRSFLETHAKLAHKSMKARAAHTPAVAAFAQAIRASKEMVKLFDQIFMQVDKESTVNTLFVHF